MKKNDVVSVSEEANKELQGFYVTIKNRIWNGTTYDYIVRLGHKAYFVKGEYVRLIK